jgi:hypothetical protein
VLRGLCESAQRANVPETGAKPGRGVLSGSPFLGASAMAVYPSRSTDRQRFLESVYSRKHQSPIKVHSLMVKEHPQQQLLQRE